MKPTKENVQWVNDRLEHLYGLRNQKSRPDPLEDLITTILSQNTTDTNRDRAFKSLKAKYTTWEEVYQSDREELKETIRVAGLGEQKSKAIKASLEWLNEFHGSLDMNWVCQEDPQEMINLFTQVKGIGIKTISIVLCFACGKDVFPVDIHVNRVCKRLGLSSEKAAPNKTFRIMADLVPEGKSRSLHLNMITLGREICKARKPRCNECVLLEKCNFGQKEYKKPL